MPSARSASPRLAGCRGTRLRRRSSLRPKGFDVTYEADAVKAILDYTEGYPYFLQEYGQLVWDIAPRSPITRGDVADAREAVEAKLDSSFFRVRAERTSDLELRYMKAMAELGADAQSAKDVAAMMGRTSEQLGPTRSRLIEKGLLYTPGPRPGCIHRPTVRPLYALRPYPHGKKLSLAASGMRYD
jgi:hypothetical protein